MVKQPQQAVKIVPLQKYYHMVQFTVHGLRSKASVYLNLSSNMLDASSFHILKKKLIVKVMGY